MPKLSSLNLPSNQAHIHQLEWRLQDSPEIPYQNLLSAEELERAQRFHFAKDRQCFALARGTLRTLLGQYLRIDPQEIRFKYNEYGKPELHCSQKHQALHFNISHSGNLILLAFSQHPVGVDVEQIKLDTEVENIAERYFSKPELEWLHEQAKAERHAAFFKLWTLKEAFIKAVGEGLSYPLHDFAVLRKGENKPQLEVFKNPEEGKSWSLELWSPAAGYQAAVAVRKSGKVQIEIQRASDPFA